MLGCVNTGARVRREFDNSDYKGIWKSDGSDKTRRKAPGYLQTDGDVDSRTEGGADGAGGQADVFEELGEGMSERNSRPFLRNHHTSADAGQVDSSCLEKT